MYRVFRPWCLLQTLAIVQLAGGAVADASGQERAPARATLTFAPCEPAARPAPLAIPSYARGLPINLPTALRLSKVSPIDVAVASERIRTALAQLDRARVLWLPSIQMGADYFRHDGRIQAVQGDVFDASKSALMLGVGPNAVFAVTDAIFAPLAARQVLRAREATLQSAANDSMLAVAEAYFTVQQARGELAGAADAVRRSEELVRRAEGLAPSLAPPVEVVRARTELARRRQTVATARERWRTASAELVRLLRLDAGALVEPLEPPELRIALIRPDLSLDNLIEVGLLNRPELAAQQALVLATLQRLRQERLRPLVPSVLLRGASTNPAGTLAAGTFGGGTNEFLGNFGARGDFDVQLIWQLDNLGLGNQARVNERRAENRLARLELFRTQDRIAAEVATAYAQGQTAAERVGEAEQEVRDAIDSVAKNFEGLGQTKRAGNLVLLVIRPQEAVAAVQALGQAYADFYTALADYNRAQFRLYRALGQPGHLALTNPEEGCPGGPAAGAALLPAPAPQRPLPALAGGQ